MDARTVITIGLLLTVIIMINGCHKDYKATPDLQIWDNPVGECSPKDEFPYCKEGKGFLLSIKIGESDE